MENTFHTQWHITDFCNLRCKHCYQSEFTRGSELTFAELKNIFANIVSFAKKEDKKLVLDVTGGEPFLHKNLHELMQVINSCEEIAECGIITNGLFLDSPAIDKLARLKNFTLKVSAEGFTKTAYEDFRGAGTYGRFMEACRLLCGSTLETTLMFTVFPENICRVEEIFSFMAKYNFNSAVLERFIPWGRGIAIKDRLVSAGEWKWILKQMCRRCGIEESGVSELIPYRGFMVERNSGGFSLFGAPCIVGRDGLAVMPDAEVFPCRRFPLSIGNLQKEKLQDIWRNSEILQKVKKRELLQGRCKTCIIDDCFGCRALAYSVTGDFMGEDPLCIK